MNILPDIGRPVDRAEYEAAKLHARRHVEKPESRKKSPPQRDQPHCPPRTPGHAAPISQSVAQLHRRATLHTFFSPPRHIIRAFGG
jgi:hypothetical protein